ncbi:MAG: hypothetical protein E6G10_22110 [Actinobacteria bacterium]|nr:MAG: hypothetical protein E6G10_22110 [Actinomycetota bacterium]
MRRRWRCAARSPREASACCSTRAIPGPARGCARGVRWHEVEHGTADIVGVPRGVIEHFRGARRSSRSSSAAANTRRAPRQIATLETRRRKDYSVPVHRLRAQWRAHTSHHDAQLAVDLVGETRSGPPRPARR